MNTIKLICKMSILGSIILIIVWSLVVYFHGENTTTEEQSQIAEPIFRGSTITIILSIVLLTFFGLLSKRKNLSNS